MRWDGSARMSSTKRRRIPPITSSATPATISPRSTSGGGRQKRARRSRNHRTGLEAGGGVPARAGNPRITVRNEATQTATDSHAHCRRTGHAGTRKEQKNDRDRWREEEGQKG